MIETSYIIFDLILASWNFFFSFNNEEWKVLLELEVFAFIWQEIAIILIMNNKAEEAMFCLDSTLLGDEKLLG